MLGRAFSVYKTLVWPWYGNARAVGCIASDEGDATSEAAVICKGVSNGNIASARKVTSINKVNACSKVTQHCRDKAPFSNSVRLK